MKATSNDWQIQALEGLKGLNMETMPAMELLYLDGLAAHLLGEDAPAAPFTVEHGTAIVSHLLRAVANAAAVDLGLEPDEGEQAAAAAREAVVEGAHRLGSRGGPGVHQLVSRFLTAVVAELEEHKDDPEAQVRSLFHYGLLAIASGPENQTNVETSEGVLAAFAVWDERIGAGFVPSWRIVA